MESTKPVVIVIADDDPDDRLLIVETFRESSFSNPIVEVENGEELLDYLRYQGKYADAPRHFSPCLILLDLNMPRMDGREALEEIKKDPRLRKIPVVILTTSKAEEDIVRSYTLGANSFITKPVTVTRFIDALKTLHKYWLQVVSVPEEI